MVDDTGESPAQILGAIAGGVSGAALGKLLAKELGLKGAKKKALIATATVGGAALGAFLGPYASKLGRKAFNAVKTYGKKIAKKVTQKKVVTYCFIAGTHILAEDGKVQIEDIKIGDWVYAENPETGEIKLKPVVQTFESETYELVHITINGEEIITTPGHPFYVVGKGWIGADRLTTNDNVLLYNQKDVTVESIRVEHLKESITVYNFEVDDYHTYFVGENSILVHNKGCDLQKISGSYLKKLKLDAHAIKYEYLGKKAKISLYDLAVDKKTGIIYIVDKAGKIIAETVYKTK